MDQDGGGQVDPAVAMAVVIVRALGRTAVLQVATVTGVDTAVDETAIPTATEARVAENVADTENVAAVLGSDAPWVPAGDQAPVPHAVKEASARVHLSVVGSVIIAKVIGT